jgi:hypothetical protein
MRAFPEDGTPNITDKIVAYVVPSFHIVSHLCEDDFNLRYTPGAGHSDGEGPERTWWGMQGGGSAKEMGPGSWSGTLDDLFGHWNWGKFVHIGK